MGRDAFLDRRLRRRRVVAARSRPAGRPLHAAELQPLEIVTKSGVRNFSVELAVTDAELDRGLMFRRELPEGRGMLFDFKHDQPVVDVDEEHARCRWT